MWIKDITVMVAIHLFGLKGIVVRQKSADVVATNKNLTSIYHISKELVK